MNSFKIISITHKLAPLKLIGKLHLDESNQSNFLAKVKESLQLKELMYLSTCNRVEFLVVLNSDNTNLLLTELFNLINPHLTDAESDFLINCTNVYENEQALTHLFEVSASLDSLVVGEREIITQVRKSYEFCNSIGITGDVIRLAIKHTIETAKQVYTQTDIAKNPVSIVSLAYRKLRDLGIKNNARIIFVGAGETNILMAQYLKKHQYANFNVFNRSLNNAQKLADQLHGSAHLLENLVEHTSGFDVIIACTAAQEPTITTEIYTKIIGNDLSRKVVIDLGLPNDFEKQITSNFDITYIDIESLKKQADENLLKREGEVEICKKIIFNKVEEFKLLFQERKIELAFSEIPKQIKNIKDTALNEVFAKDINNLDEQGKLVLEKVLSYMEKKYNALAIKTAKRVFMEEENLTS